jgi:hypothetical protein
MGPRLLLQDAQWQTIRRIAKLLSLCRVRGGHAMSEVTALAHIAAAALLGILVTNVLVGATRDRPVARLVAIALLAIVLLLMW